MNIQDIVVLIPTRKRPKKLERVLDSLFSTAPGIGILVALDRDDKDSFEVVTKQMVHFISLPPRMGCVYGWNEAMRAAPNYNGYVLGADDFIFMPRWYEETMIALEKLNGSGMVGFNDLRKRGDVKFATSYLMTRDFIQQYNGGVMAIPHYKAGYTDTETTERAKRAGKYIWARNAIVKHDWEGGKKYPDETYLLSLPRMREAKYVYKQRKAEGFPDDFERII